MKIQLVIDGKPVADINPFYFDNLLTCASTQSFSKYEAIGKSPLSEAINIGLANTEEPCSSDWAILLENLKYWGSIHEEATKLAAVLEEPLRELKLNS